MLSFKKITLLLATVLLPFSAMAQNKGIDLLREMETKFQNLKSVAGNFQQTRADADFGTKQTSPGTFRLLKPGYFHMIYNDPSQTQQLIYENTHYFYVGSLRQLSTYKFKNSNSVQDINFLVLGFGAKADDVQKVFKVDATASGSGIKLTPRNPQQATYEYISIEVDPQSLYPKTFTMREPNKTEVSVSLDLSTLQVNPQLTADHFKPNFPKDVKPVQF